MKKLIAILMAAAVIAPVALPSAAQAQHRQHRGDRDNDRGDRRGDHRGDQRGNRGNDYRSDRDRNWGDNDWRAHRNGNRGVYSRGNWRAPFRYNRFSAGARIGVNFFGPRYVINDPWRYHLPRARYGQVWVRHYDDLLLVDTRRGIVIRVINNFYW